MVDVATFFFYARFEIHKICIERLFLWLWIISSNQYPHFIIITQCCICILPSISNEIHNSATNPMNPWQFYVGTLTCILINGTGRRGMGICWQCQGINYHYAASSHDYQSFERLLRGLLHGFDDDTCTEHFSKNSTSELQILILTFK